MDKKQFKKIADMAVLIAVAVVVVCMVGFMFGFVQPTIGRFFGMVLLMQLACALQGRVLMLNQKAEE